MFELEYTAGRRMMTEVYRKITIGPRPVTTAVIAGMFIMVFLFANWMGIWKEISGMFFFMLTLEVVLFFLPNLVAWSSLRGARKKNGGQIPVTRVSLGEDDVQLFEGMTHITVPYGEICRVVKLKHSYVLMLGKRNGLLLDPHGFTKGNLEECKIFLQTKCPQLRIP